MQHSHRVALTEIEESYRMESPTNPASENEQSFAERCKDTIESGFICLGLSIGHRLKLFDAIGDIASESAPKTSEEIASRAGLKER